MKYTREQIDKMSWQEWNEAMAKELNSAGFRNTKHTAEGYKETLIEANYEPMYFSSSELNDADRIEYLKDIGLLDNGRCPICGGKIDNNPGRYTNRFDKAINYQICHNCVVTKGGLIKPSSSGNTPTSSGCMVVIIAIVVVSIISSILL